MLGGEKTRCPNCQSENVRFSKWHSRSEKGRYPGCHPYRCEECGTRFMQVAGPQSNRWGLVLAGVGGFVVMLVVLVAAISGEQATVAEGAAETGISLVITPEAMKAAEGGDPEAQFSVANAMLADAELNLAYSSKAVEFLQGAAEHGHKRAMLRLGQLYRRGVGALQNYALAAKWIESAAKNGEPQGMLELGRLYREGVGVDKDLVSAYVWLNRAAAAHDPVAVREREEVARILTPDDLKRAQDQSAQGEAVKVNAADASLKTAMELSARH